MVMIHIVRNQVSLINIHLQLNLPMSSLEVMKVHLITWIPFFNYPPPRNDWFFSGQQHEGQSSQSHTQSQEETQDLPRHSF